MMKALVIYHNQKCSTSRQVLSILKEKGFNVTVVNYLQNPPERSELEHWMKNGSISPEKLIRWKEAVVKTSGLKKETVSAEEAINLILQNPVAMERPVLVSEKAAVVARPLNNLDELISLL